MGWAAAEYDLTYTMRSVGKYMKDQKSRRNFSYLTTNQNQGQR